MNKKNKGARIKGRSENNKKKMRHKETWNSDNHVQNKDLKNYKTRRPRQDFCLRLSERSGLLFVSIQWTQPFRLILILIHTRFTLISFRLTPVHAFRLCHCCGVVSSLFPLDPPTLCLRRVFAAVPILLAVCSHSRVGVDYLTYCPPIGDTNNTDSISINENTAKQRQIQTM